MDKKFILGVVVVSVVILGGGMFMALRLPAVNGASVEEKDEAKVEVPVKWQKFGDVPLSGGNVVRIYEVKNVGSVPVEIANMSTSCMCTTAQLKTAQGESPAFGMHQKSGWKGVIAPGEMAQVEVIFDPAFHGPNGKGDISRMVKFETNDANNKEIELMLTGKVI